MEYLNWIPQLLLEIHVVAIGKQLVEFVLIVSSVTSFFGAQWLALEPFPRVATPERSTAVKSGFPPLLHRPPTRHFNIGELPDA